MRFQISSQLDTLETSVDSAPPESYRKFCIANFPDEYQAAVDAYEVYDMQDGGSRSARLSECRTLAHFARNVKTGLVKVVSSSCHQRWCPMCSATRRWFLTQQVKSWLKDVRQPKFLTLTLAHDDIRLEHQIDFLYTCFKKYRNLKLLKNHIRGGVWFFQIHRSKRDKLWHPHLHCVIDSPWIDKYKLSADWKHVTRDSEIINIKEVKHPDKMAEYVARYAARPSLLSSLDVPGRHELLQTLHGRRLVGTWGNARTISLRPGKPPDADDWENVGYYKEVFHRINEDDPKAKAIWKAFATGTELAVDCNVLPDSAKPQLETDWTRSVLENKQILLDFY